MNILPTDLLVYLCGFLDDDVTNSAALLRFRLVTRWTRDSLFSGFTTLELSPFAISPIPPAQLARLHTLRLVPHADKSSILCHQRQINTPRDYHHTRPSWAFFNRHDTLLNLRELFITTNFTIKTATLSRLPKLTNLTTLVVSSAKLKPVVAKWAAKLTKLRLLCLSYGRTLHKWDKTHSGSEIQSLTVLTNLVGLSVPFLSIDNTKFILQRMPQLQNIHIARISIDPSEIVALTKEDRRWANLIVKPQHAKIQMHLLACNVNSLEVVKKLVEAGSDINGDAGVLTRILPVPSVLQVAVSRKQWDVVSYLIEQGASVNSALPSRPGKPAFHSPFCQWTRYREVRDRDEQKQFEAFVAFRQKGHDVQALPMLSFPTDFCMVKNECRLIVAQLLKSPPPNYNINRSVDQTSMLGLTSDSEMALLLIQSGANPWVPIAEQLYNYVAYPFLRSDRMKTTFSNKSMRGRNIYRHQVSTRQRLEEQRQQDRNATQLLSQRRGIRNPMACEIVTGFHHMAVNGFSQAIQECIVKGIKIPTDGMEFSSPGKLTILHAACMKVVAGSFAFQAVLEYLEFALADNPEKLKSYLNAKTANGESTLQLLLNSTATVTVELLDKLKSLGMDFHQKIEKGSSVLSMVTLRPDLLNYFLAQNFPIELPPTELNLLSQCISPTRRGEDQFDPKLFNSLLAKGSSINNRSTIYKTTPLHNSACYSYQRTAQTLLSQGADPYIPNVIGELPVHIATVGEEGWDGDLLFNASQDAINYRTPNGRSLLHYKMSEVFNYRTHTPHPATLSQLLLKAQFEPKMLNAFSVFGTPFTLLCQAIASNQADMKTCFAEMLSKGADLNTKLNFTSSNSRASLRLAGHVPEKLSAALADPAAESSSSDPRRAFDLALKHCPDFDLDLAWKLSGRVYDEAKLIELPLTLPPKRDLENFGTYFWDRSDLLIRFPFAEMDASPRRGMSIFHMLDFEERGDEFLVECARRGADLEAKTDRGETPVLFLTLHCKHETLNALFLAGANFDTKVDYFRVAKPKPKHLSSLQVTLDPSSPEPVSLSSFELALRLMFRQTDNYDARQRFDVVLEHMIALQELGGGESDLTKYLNPEAILQRPLVDPLDLEIIKAARISLEAQQPHSNLAHELTPLLAPISLQHWPLILRLCNAIIHMPDEEYEGDRGNFRGRGRGRGRRDFSRATGDRYDPRKSAFPRMIIDRVSAMVVFLLKPGAKLDKFCEQVRFGRSSDFQRSIGNLQRLVDILESSGIKITPKQPNKDEVPYRDFTDDQGGWDE